ncbi:MAG: hypothetical protein GY730_11100 [bacterium]|nr:hypothetical protein [bacterium]
MIKKIREDLQNKTYAPEPDNINENNLNNKLNQYKNALINTIMNNEGAPGAVKLAVTKYLLEQGDLNATDFIKAISTLHPSQSEIQKLLKLYENKLFNNDRQIMSSIKDMTEPLLLLAKTDPDLFKTIISTPEFTAVLDRIKQRQVPQNPEIKPLIDTITNFLKELSPKESLELILKHNSVQSIEADILDLTSDQISGVESQELIKYLEKSGIIKRSGLYHYIDRDTNIDNINFSRLSFMLSEDLQNDLRNLLKDYKDRDNQKSDYNAAIREVDKNQKLSPETLGSLGLNDTIVLNALKEGVIKPARQSHITKTVDSIMQELTKQAAGAIILDDHIETIGDNPASVNYLLSEIAKNNNKDNILDNIKRSPQLTRLFTKWLNNPPVNGFSNANTIKKQLFLKLMNQQISTIDHARAFIKEDLEAFMPVLSKGQQSRLARKLVLSSPLKTVPQALNTVIRNIRNSSIRYSSKVALYKALLDEERTAVDTLKELKSAGDNETFIDMLEYATKTYPEMFQPVSGKNWLFKSIPYSFIRQLINEALEDENGEMLAVILKRDLKGNQVLNRLLTQQTKLRGSEKFTIKGRTIKGLRAGTSQLGIEQGGITACLEKALDEASKDPPDSSMLDKLTGLVGKAWQDGQSVDSFHKLLVNSGRIEVSELSNLGLANSDSMIQQLKDLRILDEHGSVNDITILKKMTESDFTTAVTAHQLTKMTELLDKKGKKEAALINSLSKESQGLLIAPQTMKKGRASKRSDRLIWHGTDSNRAKGMRSSDIIDVKSNVMTYLNKKGNSALQHRILDSLDAQESSIAGHKSVSNSLSAFNWLMTKSSEDIAEDLLNPDITEKYRNKLQDLIFMRTIKNAYQSQPFSERETHHKNKVKDILKITINQSLASIEKLQQDVIDSSIQEDIDTLQIKLNKTKKMLKTVLVNFYVNDRILFENVLDTLNPGQKNAVNNITGINFIADENNKLKQALNEIRDLAIKRNPEYAGTGNPIGAGLVDMMITPPADDSSIEQQIQHTIIAAKATSPSLIDDKGEKVDMINLAKSALATRAKEQNTDPELSMEEQIGNFLAIQVIKNRKTNEATPDISLVNEELLSFIDNMEETGLLSPEGCTKIKNNINSTLKNIEKSFIKRHPPDALSKKADIAFAIALFSDSKGNFDETKVYKHLEKVRRVDNANNNYDRQNDIEDFTENFSLNNDLFTATTETGVRWSRSLDRLLSDNTHHGKLSMLLQSEQLAADDNKPITTALRNKIKENTGIDIPILNLQRYFSNNSFKEGFNNIMAENDHTRQTKLKKLLKDFGMEADVVDGRPEANKYIETINKHTPELKNIFRSFNSSQVNAPGNHNLIKLLQSLSKVVSPEDLAADKKAKAKVAQDKFQQLLQKINITFQNNDFNTQPIWGDAWPPSLNICEQKMQKIENYQRQYIDHDPVNAPNGPWLPDNYDEVTGFNKIKSLVETRIDFIRTIHDSEDQTGIAINDNINTSNLDINDND